MASLQASAPATRHLLAALPPNAVPYWQFALTGTRQQTFVTLIPFKTSQDSLFTGFIALEADSLIHFSAFDTKDPGSMPPAFASAPEKFEINHALNALNHRGFGKKVYSTAGLSAADLHRLDQVKRPADSQLQEDDIFLPVESCYNWSTCIGDGYGNCIGETYYFSECITITYWIDTSNPPPGYPYDEPGMGDGGVQPPDPSHPGGPSGTPPAPMPPPQTPIDNLQQYLDCFTSQLPAKVTIYVDQPVPGSTEPVSILGGIGHAYLSFEQQADDQLIRRTIGFYAADGVDPFRHKSSAAILGNDAGRTYDVKLTIEVSGAQLEAMLVAVKGYPEAYHMDDYNCVNFVLDVAGPGGIVLPRTRGWWYTGSGLNPGNLGEDLRKQTGAIGQSGQCLPDTGSCQ
ncbi:hypothetical protein EGT74_06620 [Chitinophaga lutea]|uniref:Uncharacterized protein n=2 Tax=Chitinophaga lutea TaxID=2488634 RepID=A0A3N4Q1X1_9BACT|nr:hypothetical protein EGT74_06620 [Chitinophaga lutea]